MLKLDHSKNFKLKLESFLCILNIQKSSSWTINEEINKLCKMFLKLMKKIMNRKIAKHLEALKKSKNNQLLQAKKFSVEKANFLTKKTSKFKEIYFMRIYINIAKHKKEISIWTKIFKLKKYQVAHYPQNHQLNKYRMKNKSKNYNKMNLQWTHKIFKCLI